MQFWNELEGQAINGRHPLRRLLRSEGRSAWFESETGDPVSSPATISLTEALTDADEVTARLTAAQQLKHPNLVTITKVGQVTLDDTLFVYAVMEYTEQSLSDVLQMQALSPEEGREVAEALVGALTAVHQSGMSHGHVEAASVLATGETVKLRSDCLQTSTANQAEDVAAIGATLFHAFTQRKSLTATDAQVNRIPAPFAEIIRNSFARRWTLAQISNALKPVLPVATPLSVAAPLPVATPTPVAAPMPVATPTAPPPAPVRPAVAPASEPLPVQDPVKAAPVAPRLPTPPITVKKPLPLAIEEDEKPVAAKKTPLALYGAVAVVVLAIIGWLLLRPGSTPTAASAPSPQTQAVASAPSVAEKPTASTKPAAAKSLVAKPAAAKAAPSGPADRSVWRVVAYTYKGQTKAADMVAKINGKHPGLGAEVYSPRGGDYLVTVGGAMDRSEATKTLDKARRMGLPADSYVTNFSR